MTQIFDLNHLGAIFKVKLLDCLDDSDFDASNITDQFIVIYRPDGTSTEHLATKIEIPESSGMWFIQYINGNDNPIPETTSILDLPGWYEYVAKITLPNGDTKQNPQRAAIWVS